MKIGIVGSRKRADKENIIKYVNSLNAEDIVISGGCAGVDTWAETAAKNRGMKTSIFRPDLRSARAEGGEKWRIVKAYYDRNYKIADACDILAAFPDSSRKGGTENAIKHAEKMGKKVVLL